ncbi:MAG: DUF4298 domain-containing protein [Clostridia bacterium]|nr:DUF4298 domain-containing protein [Clostridia bacterium]MBQ6000753.1 DUF4298 domain-containing protein [Clostridia bacterium]
MSDSLSPLERIAEMEGILERCSKAVASLSAELDHVDGMRDEMLRLFRYYGSAAWYEDRDLQLPESVKAGVLSEDLVYDEIIALRDAAFHMLELASDILKNRIA